MGNLSELLSTCKLVFEAVSKTTTVFVPFLFVFRIVGANILGEGSRVFAVFKSLVVYFVLIAIFPHIVEILFSIPESFLPSLSSSRPDQASNPDWHDISMIPFVLDRIFEVLLSVTYWLAFYLHGFLMILMCSMAPIVFLASTLMGLSLGIEFFFALLVISSSWPIIWYGFDQVHTVLSLSQEDAFGTRCLELLLTILKGLTPLAFGSLLVKSGPGRAAVDSVRMATGTSSWIQQKTSNSLQSLKNASASFRRMSYSDRAAQRVGGSLTMPKTKGPKATFDRLERAKTRIARGLSRATNIKKEKSNARSRT